MKSFIRTILFFVVLFISVTICQAQSTTTSKAFELSDVIQTKNTGLLVFSKITGPDWLSVHPDGHLSGTPQIEDIGLNEFIVRVEDDLGVSDEAILRIQVIASTQPPSPPKNLNAIAVE